MNVPVWAGIGAIVVGGTATLGGGLQVNSLAPFTGNTTYSLITAGGGVNGRPYRHGGLPNLATVAGLSGT